MWLCQGGSTRWNRYNPAPTGLNIGRVYNSRAGGQQEQGCLPLGFMMIMIAKHRSDQCIITKYWKIKLNKLSILHEYHIFYMLRNLVVAQMVLHFHWDWLLKSWFIIFLNPHLVWPCSIHNFTWRRMPLFVCLLCFLFDGFLGFFKVVAPHSLSSLQLMDSLFAVVSVRTPRMPSWHMATQLPTSLVNNSADSTGKIFLLFLHLRDEVVMEVSNYHPLDNIHIVQS